MINDEGMSSKKGSRCDKLSDRMRGHDKFGERFNMKLSNGKDEV